MRHASANPFSPPRMRIRAERLASTVAFVVLLGSWCAVYATVCPGEVRPAHHQIAALARP